MCLELDIDVDEQVAHTLWDPMDIIASNGGTPPLTYEMFVVTFLKSWFLLKVSFKMLLFSF